MSQSVQSLPTHFMQPTCEARKQQIRSFQAQKPKFSKQAQKVVAESPMPLMKRRVRVELKSRKSFNESILPQDNPYSQA